MFANGANKCKYFEPRGVFILFTLDKYETVEINLFVISTDLLNRLDLLFFSLKHSQTHTDTQHKKTTSLERKEQRRNYKFENLYKRKEHEIYVLLLLLYTNKMLITCQQDLQQDLRNSRYNHHGPQEGVPLGVTVLGDEFV